MPLFDFSCRCGLVVADLYRSIAVGAQGDLPACPACGAIMQWIPAVGAMDAKEPFQQLTFDRRQPDGSYIRQQVGSVHQMRQIERESEQAHRNGEGEAVRFRMWNHDASNGDVNSFGPDPAQKYATLTAAQKRKWGLRGAAKALGDAAPDHAYGPGVSDANTSALK